MLTVADRGEGGGKILLTSYVNAPQTKSSESPISKFHNFSASFCIVIKFLNCFIVF